MQIWAVILMAPILGSPEALGFVESMHPYCPPSLLLSELHSCPAQATLSYSCHCPGLTGKTNTLGREASGYSRLTERADGGDARCLWR